jgi:hypothetical protein
LLAHSANYKRSNESMRFIVKADTSDEDENHDDDPERESSLLEDAEFHDYRHGRFMSYVIMFFAFFIPLSEDSLAGYNSRLLSANNLRCLPHCELRDFTCYDFLVSMGCKHCLHIDCLWSGTFLLEISTLEEHKQPFGRQ